MNNDHKDKLRFELHGHLSVSVVDRETKEVIDHYEDHNIIVLDSRISIIHAISDASTAYRISTLKVGDDVGEDGTLTGSPAVIFTDNTGVNDDTITRSSGSWVNDGFLDEMVITVSNTVNNNGTYTVRTVSDTTLTLVGSGVVNNATENTAIITGTPSLNNPAPAKETYNESTMSVVYATTDPFSVGYGSTTSVTFSNTIRGTDVLANWPGEQTKIITSVALHTGNNTLFAYRRFPQKSISGLVDLIINWSISY